jgi:hypothetical protein
MLGWHVKRLGLGTSFPGPQFGLSAHWVGLGLDLLVVGLSAHWVGLGLDILVFGLSAHWVGLGLDLLVFGLSAYRLVEVFLGLRVGSTVYRVGLGANSFSLGLGFTVDRLRLTVAAFLFRQLCSAFWSSGTPVPVLGYTILTSYSPQSSGSVTASL